MRSIGCFPQTLRPIVYVFLNFDRNFANLVAPSTDGSAKRLVHNWRRYASSNWYKIDQKMRF